MPADSAEGSVLAPTVATPAGKKSPQSFWTILVVLLSLASIAIESAFHLLATVVFDPLPNAGYLVAYVVAALAPLLAGNLLRGGSGGLLSRWLSEERLLATATVISFLSALVAFIACFMLGPILLICAVAVLYFGLGLIGLTPLLLAIHSTVQFFGLRALWRERRGSAPLPGLHVRLPIVLLSAVAVVWIVARPLAVGGLMATALDPGRPDEGTAVTWLRRLGGEDAVLARCYGARLPYFEALGYQATDGVLAKQMPSGWPGWDNVWDRRGGANKSEKRLYYLMTGRSFTSAAAPWTVRHQRPGNWVTDVAAEETGGTRVGRIVPGLSLASSKVEGVLDPATASTEYDWTLVFRNAGADAAEARADIVLPPGGTVHKVSLWINGEERPAAFGATAQVRKAYESVAVVQRRDPLLVTMPAPGRILAQCFPVPAGKTMQIRLGITAPLAPQEQDFRAMTFTPPAFGQVNFEQPLTLKHEFTLRAPYPSGGAWPASQGWDIEERNGRKTVRASFGRNVLFAPPRLTVAYSPLHLRELGMPVPFASPRELILVLDTGAAMKKSFGDRERTALVEALAKLPAGSQIRLWDARYGHGMVPLDASGAFGKIRAWLDLRRFVGGVDAVPALSAAIKEASPGGTVLFIHGPVPEAVSDPTPLVKALKEQRPDVTFLGLQAVAQSPNAIDDRLATLRNARSETVATFGGELAEAIATVLPGSKAQLHRLRHPYVNPGDPRWRRIDTAGAALDAWYEHGNFGPEAWKASKAAADARLVTPLSGAVVLETQEQYEEHGLDDGTKKKKAARAKGKKGEPLPEVAEASANTTSIPEPGTLFLMGGAGALALLGGAARRRLRSRRR
ncbi:MAG TPA: PEP-CTERM sorting domain-containing protein [Armatimonadaceae bacterium]|nr:PEP-CTERM sorting domain-containing protein [Armatimonadaceae bacterium]